LARVPLHRIDAWRRDGIVRPSLITTDEDGKTITGYSFDDLVYLRVIRMLRDDRGMPLELAVRSVKHIVDRCGAPSAKWADARILIDSGRVLLIQDDEWVATVASMHGQRLMDAVFGSEFDEMKARADALLVPKKFGKHVVIDPMIRDGQPVVRGTGIETSVIRSVRRQVAKLAEIKEWFPVLRIDQIRAAIGFEQFLDAEAVAL
jgi:uncharacterized protein (DUF433 family)